MVTTLARCPLEAEMRIPAPRETALLCIAAVALSFMPLMRFADADGKQGLVFALIVCGTYGAAPGCCFARSSWHVPALGAWALVIVAGIGMGIGVNDFLSGLPPLTAWSPPCWSRAHRPSTSRSA